MGISTKQFPSCPKWGGRKYNHCSFILLRLKLLPGMWLGDASAGGTKRG